jgi:hypothetical protein
MHGRVAAPVELLERAGKVVMRLGEVGPQRQRSLVGSEGLFVALGRLQRVADVEQRLGKIRFEPERAFVAADRLLMAAERLERVPEVEERRREVRLDLDGRRGVANCLGGSVERLEQVAEVVLRVDVSGNLLEQRAVELLGFRKPSILVKGDRLAERLGGR